MTTNNAPRIKYYQNEVSILPVHEILSKPSFFLEKEMEAKRGDQALRPIVPIKSKILKRSKRRV